MRCLKIFGRPSLTGSTNVSSPVSFIAVLLTELCREGLECFSHDGCKYNTEYVLVGNNLSIKTTHSTSQGKLSDLPGSLLIFLGRRLGTTLTFCIF